MNVLKKPVSFLLILLLLISVFAAAPVSFSAGAVDEYTEGNYKYTVSNNKATITKYIGHAKKVVIPSTLGGYPVTCIAYAKSTDAGSSEYAAGAFGRCKTIESVMIPSTVKTIGYRAFYACTSLSDVSISNGVEEIKNEAFAVCYNLSKIVLPDSVKLVENGAFKSGLNYEDPNDPNHTLAEGIPYGIKELTLHADSSSNFRFHGIRGTLENVTFSYGSTVIPDYLFGSYDADNRFIGAFSNIKTITIPNTVISIGTSAFRGCSICEINIPSSVKYIWNSAFNGCSGLREVTLHKGLKSIMQNAFSGCSNLYHIILPRTLETLGKGAFSGCDSLSAIDIPGSVDTIESEAFAYCHHLHTVVIHRGVKSIGKWAFHKDDGVTHHSYYTNKFDDNHAIDNESEDNMALDIYIPLSVGSIAGKRTICSPNYDYYDVVGAGWEIYYTNNACIHAPDGSEGKSYYESNNDYFYSFDMSFSKVTDGDTIFNDYKDEDDLAAEADGGTPLADMQAVLGIVGGSEALLSYVGEDINVELSAFLDDDTPLKRIGREAFKNLDIESIGFPNSVENIDEWAFHGCKELGRATLNAGLKEIGHYAFQNCSKLTDINLPDSLTEIGAGAFSQCKKLTDIELPSNLTNLWNGAFEYCSGLENIDIPEGIKIIGNEAFRNTGLQDVHLPDSITTLARSAFEECSDLRSINIPSNIRNLGSAMFANCKSLSIVDLSGVTTIGDKAFSACKSLGNISFPDELNKINDSSFTDCINLEDFELPEGITSLGNAVFGGCDALRNIDLPDSITSIGDAAFENCKNLRKIELPNGVASIGDYTFSNCENLKAVVIPDGVTSISAHAFDGCDNVTIFGYKNSYAEEYAEDNGIPFIAHTVSGEKATITKYNLSRISDSNLDIHSEFKGYDVTALGDELFEDCNTLTSVTLPDTLKTIGASAFKGCKGLLKVDLPDSLTTIGDSAFSNCTELMRVNIPENVQSLGASTFDSCKEINKVYIWGRTTTIGSQAFDNCPNATIYAYDSSPADTYASENNISFIPLMSINKGDENENAQLIGTQSVEDDGNNFGLNQSEYNNFELLGVQIKSDAESKDLRFIAVINEGIVNEATNGNDIEDYGFVVAKCSKTPTSSAGEDNIKKITVDNPKALAVSCKNSSNRICGDYGIYNKPTKYKYTTLAINDVDENQGIVARFYVKMKSGRVYYGKYGTDYTGCATTYNQLESLSRGENSVVRANDWENLNTFVDE